MMFAQVYPSVTILRSQSSLNQVPSSVYPNLPTTTIDFPLNRARPFNASQTETTGMPSSGDVALCPKAVSNDPANSKTATAPATRAFIHATLPLFRAVPPDGGPIGPLC